MLVSAAPPGDRGPQVGSSSPPKSFAAAATSSNPFNFNIEAKISSKDGFPAVSFSQLDFPQANLALRLSLILKFSSGRPVVDTIRSHIQKRWGLSSNVIVGIIDARHVMLQVSSEKDAIAALSRESFSIEGYFYKIYRYTTSFSPCFGFGLDSIATTPFICVPSWVFERCYKADWKISHN